MFCLSSPYSARVTGIRCYVCFEVCAGIKLRSPGLHSEHLTTEPRLQLCLSPFRFLKTGGLLVGFRRLETIPCLIIEIFMGNTKNQSPYWGTKGTPQMGRRGREWGNTQRWVDDKQGSWASCPQPSVDSGAQPKS